MRMSVFLPTQSYKGFKQVANVLEQLAIDLLHISFFPRLTIAQNLLLYFSHVQLAMLLG